MDCSGADPCLAAFSRSCCYPLPEFQCCRLLGQILVVAAGASTANWALVLILVITSVIGLFYYLRIVVTMYAPVPEEIQVPTSLHPGSYVLIALTVLLLWFGIYPGLLLNIIKTALTM